MQLGCSWDAAVVRALVATMGMRQMVQTGAVYRNASRADIFFMPFCSMSWVVAQRAPAAIVESRISTRPTPTLAPSVERLCEVASPVPKQMTTMTATSLPVSCSSPNAKEKTRMKKGAADLPRHSTVSVFGAPLRRTLSLDDGDE